MTDLGQRVDAFGRPVPEPGPPQAPQSLLVARWLWIGSVLIGGVQSFIQLLDRSRLIEELRALDPNMGQMELDAAANSMIMFAFLLKALVLMVYLMLTRRMLEGRNWSRVVLTVFGGFGVFNALITLLGVAVFGIALINEITPVTITRVDVVFTALVAVVEAAAIVFMYRPDGNRFIRAMGPRLRQGRVAR
ncbi:hypothetical protein OU415_21780 [Saccharopolyspora sp. WRP15-2]|uniref:DUF2127 domain-containing protein n=1 Tax=Saccharopolyspora oryzae TaxID=2997343 RepID=A0ABT4V2A0_9PSEU|nr:hypothetical protein [Saccharopolyspora oryzae]MDA3628079.1 hypothetical protein [Saccharopolyspora oryzae]